MIVCNNILAFNVLILSLSLLLSSIRVAYHAKDGMICTMGSRVVLTGLPCDSYRSLAAIQWQMVWANNGATISHMRPSTRCVRRRHFLPWSSSLHVVDCHVSFHKVPSTGFNWPWTGLQVPATGLQLACECLQLVLKWSTPGFQSACNWSASDSMVCRYSPQNRIYRNVSSIGYLVVHILLPPIRKK